MNANTQESTGLEVSVLSNEVQNVVAPKNIDPFTLANAKDGLEKFVQLMEGKQLPDEERLKALSTVVGLQRDSTESYFKENLRKTADAMPEVGTGIRSLGNSQQKIDEFARTWVDTPASAPKQEMLRVMGTEYLAISDGSLTRSLNSDDSLKLVTALTSKSMKDISNLLDASLARGVDYPTIVTPIEGTKASLVIQQTDRQRGGTPIVTVRMVVEKEIGMEIVANSLKNFIGDSDKGSK